MKIHVFGVGGGVPLKGLTNTNFAFQAGNKPGPFSFQRPFWLIDCGPDTVRTLVEQDACSNVQGILITHAHADHSGGLTSLAWRLMFIEKKRVPILTPAPVMRLLESQCVELRHVRSLDDAHLGSFFHLDVSEPGRAQYYEDFSVVFLPVHHGIESFPSYGIKLNGGGVRIAFSGDTVRPLPEEVLRESHLVFHDVTLREPDGTEVHCPLSVLEAALSAYQIDPAKIVAVHHSRPRLCIEDGRLGAGWRGVPDSVGHGDGC